MMKKICVVAYTYYLSDSRIRREAEDLAERWSGIDFIYLLYRQLDMGDIISKDPLLMSFELHLKIRTTCSASIFVI